MRYGKENAVILPSTAGTSGQALVYNGTNTLAWASTLPDMMTLSTAQTAIGAKTFSAPTTTFGAASAAAKLTTPGTSLVFEQTGGTYGTTRLTILNENGLNGAQFEQTSATADLVDFIFKTTTGTSNVRYERRPADFMDATNLVNEFQIGTAAAPQLVIGDVSVTVKSGINLKVGTNPVYHTGNIPGTTPQMLYNSGTGMAGATNVTVESGYLKLLTVFPATAPLAGGVMLGVKEIGGRYMPAFVDSSGWDSTVQPHIGRDHIAMLLPVLNGTTATAPTAIGMAPVTIASTTTLTPRTLATTSLATSLRRTGYVSSTAAAAMAAYRDITPQFWRGNGPGLGGFHMSHTFLISDPQAMTSARMFVGLSAGSATAPSNVEPYTLINSVGVGKVSTSSNLCIVGCNATAGTAVVQDLGASFPAASVNVDVYRLTLYCAMNSAQISWRVERLNSLDTNNNPLTVSGIITATANLPVNTAFMGLTAWRCNNAVLQAVGLDMINFYIETDT